MALDEAFRIAGVERPTYVLFLTDGLATEGELDTDDILANAAEGATNNIRVFSFGVGYDVDTILLDMLAQQHHGTSDYVTPEESIDETVSSLYRKLSNPVLTDVEIDFGGIQVYDLYPAVLPDLFSGEQLVLLGRYREGGTADLVVRGVVGDQVRTFTYEGRRFEAQGGTDAIPRLWATRKVGTLLRQIRIEGPDEETIDQIVALAIRYGIVTPYTSYLVAEDAPFGAAARDALAEQAYQAAAATSIDASGEAAVVAAETEGALSAPEANAPSVAAYRDLVRLAGSRTFRWSDGTWVDTAFDPDTMQPVSVPFLSDGYFALAEAHPVLAEAFALGEQVIVMWQGTAYRVVGEDDPADVIATTTTTPGTTSSPTTGGPTTTAEALAAAVDDGTGTPWWFLMTGMGTLAAGILAVGVLLRQGR
jgi:Ca-activated chloride channel family protein